MFKLCLPRTHKICVMKNFVTKSINICRNRTILASIESSRRDLFKNNIRTKMSDNNSVSRGAISIGTERFWRRSKARDEIYPITTPKLNSETVKPVELTIWHDPRNKNWTDRIGAGVISCDNTRRKKIMSIWTQILHKNETNPPQNCSKQQNFTAQKREKILQTYALSKVSADLDILQTYALSKISLDLDLRSR